MRRTFSSGGWAIRLAFLMIVLGAPGCEEKFYQIEQWPRDNKLWRRLTVSRHQQVRWNGGQRNLTDADKAEVARIARFYGGVAPKISGERATLVGAFASTLPRDVGGDGHYLHWESPLGRVSLYVERFRGSDDPAATLEARRKTVDQLVDLIIGWFDSELHGEVEWPALRNFLDTTFRHDLQNLSLYGWLQQIRPDSQSKDPEIAFRVIQYFVERHYASYEETPTLLRELGGLANGDDAAAFLARIRRLLVNRAGVASDGRLARALGFLNNAQPAWASWQRYFQHTAYYLRQRDEFRRRKAEEERKKAAQAMVAAALSGSGGPKPQQNPVVDTQEFEQTLYIKFLDAFIKLRLENSSRVQVSLEVPREPFWTNGKWLAKERRIEWSQTIAELNELPDARSAEWPAVCLAAWDEPNEETQKLLLGKVGITQDALLQYCLWYEGLSSREQQEWDTFLPTVRKDGHFAERLNEFHFSDEPAGHEGGGRVAFQGANAVRNALDPPGPLGLRVEPARRAGRKAAQPADELDGP
jgi:hypothetical protein